MSKSNEENCLNNFKKYILSNNNFFLSYFLSLKENPEKSQFPDFLFDGGFIEHFQVSAANENKKGSAYNIALNRFEKSRKLAFEKEKTEFLQSPPRNNKLKDTYDIKVVSHEMESPQYSYHGFVQSFKRNFEKHIKSLQKYAGEKEIGILSVVV